MGGGSQTTRIKNHTVQTPNVPGFISQPYQDFAGSVGALGTMNPSSFTTPASALQTSAFGRAAAGTGNPTQAGYDATQALVNGPGVTPGQLSSTDYSQYMNPWQQSVIDSTIGDWSHGNDLALNSLRSGANASGAFNNDRLGVAEGQLLGDNSRTLASTLANLRAGGFQNAQQAAQFDIGNRYNADTFNRQFGLGAANQLANIGLMGANNSRADTQMQADLGQTQREIDSQNNPAAALLSLLQARGGLLGMIPTGTFTGQTSDSKGTQTTSSSPGLLDYLGGFANLLGSFGGNPFVLGKKG